MFNKERENLTCTLPRPKDILLYPVGPVGWCPVLSSATKSSTWRDGGREVLGGRERKGSLLMFIPRVKERPLIGATG